MPRRRPGRSPYSLALDVCERELLQSAVKDTGGIRAAAAALGISRTYIYKRLDALGLLDELQHPPPGTPVPRDPDAA